LRGEERRGDAAAWEGEQQQSTEQPAGGDCGASSGLVGVLLGLAADASHETRVFFCLFSARG